MAELKILLAHILEQNYLPVFPLLLITTLNNDTDMGFGMFLFSLNQSHVRMDGITENWIDLYLNYDFFSLFRMTKDTFSKLYQKLDGPYFHHQYQGGGIPVPGEMQVLMTLWWMGKGEVLLSVAEKFNVSISTVHRSTNIVLEKIIGLIDNYIVWPKNLEEFEYLEAGFRDRCGFPGVIGAIDGTNVQFKAPLENQDSYIDKNENHSIKLQVICTHNRIFTNIVVGFPGSVHDARVFRNSELYLEIAERGFLRKYFPQENYHLVGDKAYPLLEWLIKPYLGDNHNLTRQQRAFNFAHSKTRIVVEHSIGLLKGRWRILKYINVNSELKAIKIIAGCCVLHNFCYLNGDEWETDDELQPIGLGYHEVNHDVDNMGSIKRNRIAELF